MTDPQKLWDQWNGMGEPNYPHAKVVQFCLRHFPREVRAGMRVLDLGCGCGVDTAFLAGEGFPVTGVDISQRGIDCTRRRLEARRLTATLHVSSADELDFQSESFDLVICVEVFDSTGPEIARRAVREAGRVLRPGGRGLFVFACDDDAEILGENEFGLHGYSRAEVDQLFSEGFSKVWIDNYITTYESGRSKTNEWLVTLTK